MEEGKSACKQWKKKKSTASTGGFHGGGIGGVVVLGGALAAAALIAFFANRINKGRPTKKDQSIDSDSSKTSTLKNKKNTDEEESEGLQLLVHPSPPSVHLNPCCKSNGTSEMGSAQIAPTELISTKNPILEEISVLEINGGKETLKNGNRDESLLSDITNPENISLRKDNGIGNEEYTLQVLEISSVLEEEVNKINVAGEEPPLLEAIEEVKKNEGASSEISFAEQEENPPMKSVEEEKKEEDADLDDDDDESEEEKSEDSSEETVDSSMESNAEAIWPTESIEKLSLALKEMNNNYQISGEKIEEDGTVKNDSSSKVDSFYDYGKEDESTRKSLVISDDKETIKLLTVKDHPVKSGKLRMLILSILGTVLLLLMLGFFTHREALFSYLVNGDSIL